MAKVDVRPTLTGVQKAAVLIMTLGRDRAAPVLARLRESEIDEVAAEIVRLRTVTPDTVNDVITEFQAMLMAGGGVAGGGIEVAHDLLAASFGAEHADAVLDRLADAHSTQPFAFLAEADPRTLVSFLVGEHPQVIALVLAHLRTEHSSLILSALQPEVQVDVAHRIGVMEGTNQEMMRVVAEVLERKTSSVIQPGRSAAVGGVQPLVDLINRADPATERVILES
jgi:flagellar motor switch protein FliG